MRSAIPHPVPKNTYLTAPTHLKSKSMETNKPKHVWQSLESGLHLDSLRHDYAPVGLLQMIQGTPREVFDVGCFCGGTGRWLKQKHPGVRMTGVEMLPAAAAHARDDYDDIHVGKFEDLELEAWKGRFDAIVVADVFEHMYNPWSALQRLRPLVCEGGSLYISMPNIRNLNILLGLANGEWPYASAGLLDITHIRFFTKRSTLEMLRETGWEGHEVKINPDPRLTPHFRGKSLDEVTTISAGKLRLDNLTKDDVLELLTLQFFIRATPVANP